MIWACSASVDLLHQVYIKNLLRVSESVDTLRDRILTAIVERLLNIDVEISEDEKEEAQAPEGQVR